MHRFLFIGGGTKSSAVRAIAPALFDGTVVLPTDGEYVALGAARQAAWALIGELPEWRVESETITLHQLQKYSRSTPPQRSGTRRLSAGNTRGLLFEACCVHSPVRRVSRPRRWRSLFSRWSRCRGPLAEFPFLPVV